LDNSSYLGELVELAKIEANLNMQNISRISLLLDEIYQEYNYIRVKDGTNTYYYYLESQEYYNNQKRKFWFNIDIIRTLYELEALNHNVNILKYSNVLDMTDQQKAYFWNHQNVKVGANIVEDYKESFIPYSTHEATQTLWKKMKWLYIWLQPRTTQTDDIAGMYQYDFTKQIKESIITVLESSLPLHIKMGQYHPAYNTYAENQVYYTSDTQRYYRCIIDWEYQNAPNRFYFKTFVIVEDFNYTTTKYYLHSIPTVEVNNIPNNLYCLVVPMSEVIVVRNYMDGGTIKQKHLSWSADNILPYLFDVESENK